MNECMFDLDILCVDGWKWNDQVPLYISFWDCKQVSWLGHKIKQFKHFETIGIVRSKSLWVTVDLVNLYPEGSGIVQK